MVLDFRVSKRARTVIEVTVPSVHGTRSLRDLTLRVGPETCYIRQSKSPPAVEFVYLANDTFNSDVFGYASSRRYVSHLAAKRETLNDHHLRLWHLLLRNNGWVRSCK
jgi:hypothetical protein